MTTPMTVDLAPALDNTFGALLIGTCVGLILYGLTLHQTYRYCREYVKDALVVKYTVATLFLLDTLHTILSVHLCYYYLVTNYFKPPALLTGVWSIRLLVPVTSLIILVAQIFYARRVYLICPARVCRVVIPLVMLCMTGQVAFVVASTVETYVQVTFKNWEDYAWLTSVGFGFSLAADHLLATTLTVHLKKQRTGFRRTDSLLNTLMLYTINTGLLTSSLCFLCLIWAIVEPNNMVYAALNMPTTKSYANSVLAVLNSRRAFRETTDTCMSFGLGTSTIGPRMDRECRGRSDEDRWGRDVIVISSKLSVRAETSGATATVVTGGGDGGLPGAALGVKITP